MRLAKHKGLEIRRLDCVSGAATRGIANFVYRPDRKRLEQAPLLALCEHRLCRPSRLVSMQQRAWSKRCETRKKQGVTANS
mmetsp:Transcript_65792/g.117272  ORF Transcript_65792/g.117272 Transcript_65792/m.117272 type:complete len:81 (+) Transcript_65792:335-577(+)